MKRVFLIVLDSFGIGSMPDSAEFGDDGANTLKTLSTSDNLKIPNLIKLGLGNIDGVDYLEATDSHQACIARLRELSKGKDTTTGHWEIAGIVSSKPFPTYPEGFPKEIIEVFEERTGRGTICNKPYSGTEVIRDYGLEHIKTGKLIVYTSADSVFQIAAHENEVSVDTLYEYCRIAREILVGEQGVGRVIARPFEGEYPDFKRTSRRHDFSLKPPKPTMLDAIMNKGYETIGIGKINDIFAGVGVSRHIPTSSNAEGIERLLQCIKAKWQGLCFLNLVDFDMLYGHRNDVEGYVNAINEFDSKLPEIMGALGDDDLMIITADHGCDPAFTGTDHTREYVPMLIYKKGIEPENYGTLDGFNHISRIVTDYLGVEYKGDKSDE